MRAFSSAVFGIAVVSILGVALSNPVAAKSGNNGHAATTATTSPTGEGKNTDAAKGNNSAGGRKSTGGQTAGKMFIKKGTAPITTIRDHRDNGYNDTPVRVRD